MHERVPVCVKMHLCVAILAHTHASENQRTAMVWHTQESSETRSLIGPELTN